MKLQQYYSQFRKNFSNVILAIAFVDLAIAFVDLAIAFLDLAITVADCIKQEPRLFRKVGVLFR